jgi:hypothetical protein
MSKIDNVRRIVVEDYGKEDRELVGKLAFILNRFMDQTVLQLNGNIDVDNLKIDLKTFKTTVDASGNPKTSLKVKSSLVKPSGTWVINAKNTTNTSSYVSGAPFISFVPDQTSGVIEIKNITGLTQDQEYELTVLIF